MRHILSPVFAIGTIHIEQVEGASCVNLGNNWPTNFQSYKKHNQGFGSVSGNNNVMSSLRSLLNDPDTFDMMSVPDNQVPEWAEQFLQDDDDEKPDDTEPTVRSIP
ncbi:hypothetical protein [Alicyclobacillus ferrooxydans]|uniref:Uncharacterized protein n=1 Tax=Alicyclobacillus ferrooxydans TaxID=471514 RepID=A0A0P9EK93_9BACL|nr:hypothetical protein [Alicyclobacillus ferrooxydans]KPV43497.1 hypothetical protein AN477_11805 [Alicyclobacillus ferrooxydans]